MGSQFHTAAGVGSRRLVVIVGGGLAGLSAAVRCVRLGLRPLVLEKRPYLGGRAFSFVDRETGVEVDNGQHVFVGACAAYVEFLREIGAWPDVRLQDRLELPVIRNGVWSQLKWGRLPGPLGLLPSLMAYRHLRLVDKLRVVYGMARIRLTDRDRQAASLETETFQSWLERRGQTEAAIRNMWNLLVLPTLNDDIADVSADMGLMLFQTALLGRAGAARIGYPRVGLSRLAGDAARQHITRSGGEVRTGADVVRLEGDESAITGARLANGSKLEADAFVVAVPHRALPPLLPPGALPQQDLRKAASMETTPVVGLHIWYDREVMSDTFVAVLDSPLQWVFNVSAMHEERGGEGQHILISLSAAREWARMDRDRLREMFLPEMARVFPAAAGARVRRFLSVKQTDATFRVTPGAAAARLPQTTSIPNLFLAGDWTRTGWPSTMESAVRSGNLAAEAASRALANRSAAR